MRISYLAVIAAVALGLSVVPAVAQLDDDSPTVTNSTHKAKPLGYTDPQTGVFHPVIRVAPEATAAPLTGTIQVTINVTIKSTFTKGSILLCSSMVTATSINLASTTGTGTDWLEDAYTTQTIGGTSATCVVTIPYSWGIPASSATVMNQLDGEYSVAVLVPGTTASTVSSVTPLRSSTSSFVSTTKMPAAGATSKFTINATL